MFFSIALLIVWCSVLVFVVSRATISAVSCLVVPAVFDIVYDIYSIFLQIKMMMMMMIICCLSIRMSVRDIDDLSPYTFWIVLKVITWIINLLHTSEPQHERSNPRRTSPNFRRDRGGVWKSGSFLQKTCNISQMGQGSTKVAINH